MPRRPTSRQCNRCGRINEGKARECVRCGEGLITPRFKMDKGRLARVHMLAQRKGLITGADREFYELRLQGMGLTSAKDMKQRHYREFCKVVGALPDRK